MSTGTKLKRFTNFIEMSHYNGEQSSSIFIHYNKQRQTYLNESPLGVILLQFTVHGERGAKAALK